MSSSFASTQSGRIDPGVVWSVLTDAPLKGLLLAREAGRALAWDESDLVYLISEDGRVITTERMPGKIQAASISDDGSLVAILGVGAKLWLLGPDLEFLEDRGAITDPTTLCLDPHGRYVAVASKMNLIQFYTRFGKLAGRLETRQPMAGLAFIPGRLAMVGIGVFGMLMGFELQAEGDSSKLSGDLTWTQNLLSSVGGMAVTGDGSAIFVASYTHGVQRFEGEGRTEGTYHVGGSATLAVPDFLGRNIAVTTMEGELSILSGSGSVRWRTKLEGSPVALGVDALGRYLLFGLATGMISKLDLHIGQDAPQVAPVRSKGRAGGSGIGDPSGTGSGSGSVRSADWTAEVVKTDAQAEVVVLAVLDDPPRVAVIGPTNRLELFGKSGKRLGQAPEIGGVGRILRTAPGWIAAATDRSIVVCDCRKGSAQKVELSLVEVTHLAIRPDDFGLAIIQERDRIGRSTTSGRWIWKRELKMPVEDLAIGAEAIMAITTEEGELILFDAGGEILTKSRIGSEPLGLLAVERGGGTIAWWTLAKRSQVIRGHDLRGRIVWESPVPFEGWQIYAVGPFCVVSAADGKSIAYDETGQVRGRSRAEGPLDGYAPGPGGIPVRISRGGVHLGCSSMDGQVFWRSILPGPIGPMASGSSGVAAIVGKSIHFFGTPESA